MNPLKLGSRWMIQADYLTRGRIPAVADRDWLGNIPVDLDRWSKDVSANMSVIVRKAHAATATLPSNVPGGKADTL